MTSFKCADLGMQCSFEVRNAGTKDEMMKLVSVHAKETHNMAQVTPDLAAKIGAAIRL